MNFLPQYPDSPCFLAFYTNGQCIVPYFYDTGPTNRILHHFFFYKVLFPCENSCMVIALYMYDLLTEMEKQEIIPVLLNTSFNVNGRPILNSYKDAFYMLENSGLRHVIIKNEYTGENGQQFTIKPEYNKFLKTN